MNRRVALALLVLAVVLIAYPIAFPPPDPPDRLSHTVRDFPGPDDPDLEGPNITRFENLTDRGQQLFLAALEDSPHEVEVGSGASDFRYVPFGSLVVHYEEENHQVLTQREFTGPRSDDVIVRMGSLVLGVLVGTVGGYGLVNPEG